MACNAVATARVKATRLTTEQAKLALGQFGQIVKVHESTRYHKTGQESPYIGFTLVDGDRNRFTVFYDSATGDVQVQIPGGFQRETDALAEQVRSALNDRAKLLIAAALRQVATVTGGQTVGNATILTLKV